MSRLDEIAARLEERPAAEVEFIAFGRQWREIYGTREVVPFPPNFSIAVQYASDLSRARHDLAALLGIVREVAALADDLASSPAVGSDSAEQWEFDTRRDVAVELRRALEALTETTEGETDEGQ